MIERLRLWPASLFCLACFAGTALGDEPVDYQTQIKPLLARRCYACHGPLKQQSGLRLDTAAFIRQGGDSGAAIEPHQSGESLLIAAVTGADGLTRMPPEGEPLSDAEIALLRAWVDQGAAAPADEAAAEDPRRHWSFQVPQRPAVPQPPRAAWARVAIDAFIAQEHQRHGLVPVGEAGRPVWLRRVYLDLIGIPPTRGELAAFVADDSSTAYEKVVDRLLASPQYGQRWGRHWMDVWRYCDPFGSGEEIRYSQRHIWRWRDWIIDSLNEDKGYDRMLVEMLAGDEIAPDDPDVVRATGFLVRNWYKFNRNAWLQEAVDHTALGFLGLTLKCARCHDHKFDPVSQEEYYRFRAFFEPHDVRTDRVPGQSDVLKDGLARVYDARRDAPTYLFERGDDRSPDEEHPLSPALPSALGSAELEIEPSPLPLASYYPALRPFVVDEMLAQAKGELAAAEAARAAADAALASAAAGAVAPTAGSDAAAALKQAERAWALSEKKQATARAKLAALEIRIAAERARYGITEGADCQALALAAGKAERQASLASAEEALLEAEQALEAARQKQASADATQDAVAQQAVAEAEKKAEAARTTLAAAQTAAAQPDAAYQPLGDVYPPTSSGRRLALARWIASRDNPRTARVAVNHMWLRHFGRPLVSTVANFGLSGKPPSHPQLLDWLSVEFMESGWSMKHLHRLVVTSAAYRLSSAGGSEHANQAIDPDNKFLWRMNYRRMESEVVRDSLLAAGGTLDSSLGGPILDLAKGQTLPRRSLYFRLSVEHKMQFLDLFDLASPTESYQRRESVVPQQALALTNSSLALSQSRQLAASLAQQLAGSTQGTTGEAFIVAAFEQVLTRRPSAAELARCQHFLDEQAALLQDAAALTAFPPGPEVGLPPSSDSVQRARENLVHVLFNHNDFVTIR